MNSQDPKFWKSISLVSAFLCLLLLSVLICVFAYSDDRTGIEYLDASRSEQDTTYSDSPDQQESSRSTASKTTSTKTTSTKTTSTKTTSTAKTTTNNTKTTEKITEKHYYNKGQGSSGETELPDYLVQDWFLRLYEDYWDNFEPPSSSVPDDSSSLPDSSLPEPPDESSLPDSSLPDSSLPSSSEPEESEEPPQEVDFSLAEEKAQALTDLYGVQLQFTTQQPGGEILPGAFTDSAPLLNQLQSLEGCLERITAYTLEGAFYLENGCRIQLLSGSNTSVTLEEMEGEQWVVVSGEGMGWVVLFSQMVSEKALEMLELSGEEFVDFASHNPEGYQYGEYREEYLTKEPENTYFVSPDSFDSEEKDRRDILTYFWSGQVPETYWTESCPAYQKFCYLQGQLDAYFLL